MRWFPFHPINLQNNGMLTVFHPISFHLISLAYPDIEELLLKVLDNLISFMYIS